MIAQNSWSESESYHFLGSLDSGFWPVLVAGALSASLMSIVAMVVMMSSTKTPSKDEDAKDEESPSVGRSGKRRFRSFSVSVDLQYLDSVDNWDGTAMSPTAGSSWERQQLKVKSGGSDRYRTMSTNYIERYRAIHYSDTPDFKMWKMQGLEMLRRMPEAFPFQSLPVDCRLLIFSMLSATDRGRAARVCTDWCSLMRMPELWTNIDFSSFALCRRCAKSNRECTPLCYAAYKSRMKSFFRFLFSVRPKIHRLRASFDIGDYKDGWLEQLQGLIRTARCQDLTDVDLNWKETPMKPVSFSCGVNATWSTGDYYDLVYQHRHRQRLFVKFFDLLVTSAPNIRRLTIPFDWSERSVRTMSRLRQLEALTLQQYFWMQSVDTLYVDQLVASAPVLKTLSLEIWSPSGHGLQSYTIQSATLEHLDVSQCRGVCLGDVYLPHLKSLVVARQPMNGPLVSHATSRPLSCLLQVLGSGAPALRIVNGQKLPTGWNDGDVEVDENLESILSAACACSVHKPS